MKEVIATFYHEVNKLPIIYHVLIDGSVIEIIKDGFNGSEVTKSISKYRGLGIILSDEQEEKIKSHLKVTEQLKKVTDK